MLDDSLKDTIESNIKQFYLRRCLG